MAAHLAMAEMASTDKKEDQGINPGDELNKIEMTCKPANA